MDSWKEKIQHIKLIVIRKIHDRSFWKRFGVVAGIAVAAGLVISLFLTRVTTVNDMIIRYTEPATEELETEGFEEEITETQEETEAEPQPESPVMAYIPEVQVKFPMLSTTHRPWILSDLSDMFHSLSTPK